MTAEQIQVHGKALEGNLSAIRPSSQMKTWLHLGSRKNILKTMTLDSSLKKHHDAIMRTTVTLEKDVERLVRDAMHSSRRSFKETLNAAIRNGLGAKLAQKKSKRFVVQARPMGLRAGIDPSSLNKVADALEVEGFLERSGSKQSRNKRSRAKLT